MSQSRASDEPNSGWPRALGWILVAALLVGLMIQRVDLAPVVSDTFFFAESDRALQAQQRIDGLFGQSVSMLVLARGPDVADRQYRDRIGRLTEALERSNGVDSVRSLATAPDDPEAIRESPLWSRYLLAEDHRTSFLVLEMNPDDTSRTVSQIEEITTNHARQDFELMLAGAPYTVDVMRRQLVRDFTVFSAAAVALFTIAIAIVFRSLWIVVGMLTVCSSAVSLTLLVLQFFGFGIGLLTANLTTIVFVLAQSHVVFMVSNWQRLAQRKRESEAPTDSRSLASRARRYTIGASGWSALTTLLGFASLLFVPARPLQELGAGGLIGSVIGFLVVFVALPSFLAAARNPTRSDSKRLDFGRWARPIFALPLFISCAVLSLGLFKVDLDPSLLHYFDEEGEVHRALSLLDREAGSSPMSIVVGREDDERLDSPSSYERLSALQRSLESRADVGRALSLPVLLDEANQNPLASLLKDEWILDLLGPERTGVFLTSDRRQTLIGLQMVEAERERPRQEIIEDLRAVVETHDLEVRQIGGLYALQSRLAELVSRSLVASLAALTALFVLVAYIASRSVAVALAAGISTALVPASALGAFGLLGVPLDVIAAPAASVGLGLAADASLHLIAAWRRLEQRPNATHTSRWREAAREQGPGILRATGIVVAGFSLFALSSFPPTRRFGMGVAAEAAVGAAVALVLLPLLAGLFIELGRRLRRGE